MCCYFVKAQICNLKLCPPATHFQGDFIHFLLVLQSHCMELGAQAPHQPGTGDVKVTGTFKHSPQWLIIETTSLCVRSQKLGS